jgi:Undecaprenyl-phosphate galactose phosphotransferase WbaP
MSPRMVSATRHAEGARVFARPGAHSQRDRRAILSRIRDGGAVGRVSRRQRVWPAAVSLLVGDLLAFAGAGMLGGIAAYFIASDLVGTEFLAFQRPSLFQQLMLMAATMAGVCGWFARSGQYTERRLFRQDLGEIWNALLIGLLINGFAEFAGKADFSRLWLVLAWLSAAIAVPLSRLAVRRMLDACGMWTIKAVIIGHGEHAEAIREALGGDRYLGYDALQDGALADHVDDAGDVRGARLDALLSSRAAQTVILVPEDGELEYLARMIDALNVRVMPYVVVPPINKLPLAGLTTQSFLSCDAVLLSVRPGLTSPLSQFVKRVFDVAASLALLLVLAPVCAIVSLIVARDGGPVLFGHERVGRDGRVFKCLKFRTMVPNAGPLLERLLAEQPALQREWATTRKLRNDPRITAVGHWLRMTSIDELPQLLNVLRGDMSLVGPRPVVEQELREHYKADNSYYLLVRPGVTGLWQVSGRNETDYGRRVYLDAWYVRNWSLWGDILILFRTFPVVMSRRGAC